MNFLPIFLDTSTGIVAVVGSSHAAVAKLRDEISLVAQAMDKRNLNITRIAAAWCASNSVKSVETPSFTSETKRGNTLNGFSIPRMCGTYSG